MSRTLQAWLINLTLTSRSHKPQPPRANMSFLNLPNELILKIANELNPPDLCSLLKANHWLAVLLYFPLIDSVCRKASKIYATEALYSAAGSRNKGVVRDLLDRGILGNVLSGNTLLNHAVERRSEAVVQTLLECGVNAETRDRYGRTPLANAADCDREGMVRILMDHGVDVNSLDKNNWGAIHWAAQLGNEGILKRFLEHKRLDIDPGPPGSLGPLHIAAAEGNTASVRILLETGRLNINRTNRLGMTPLYYAAQGGRYEVVQLLLAQKDIDIDITDYEGRSMRSSISLYPPKVFEALTRYVSPNRGNAAEPIFPTE